MQLDLRLLHSLVLIDFPPPHVLVQADHASHSPHWPSSSIGQDSTLQSFFFSLSPTQYDPPLEGAGLLHSLSLIEVPSPQVLVQVDHELHSPHWPSTLLSSSI